MLAEYRNLPRIVYVLCLGTVINRSGYFILAFLAIYVNSSLGLGPHIATWAVGCFGLGSVIAAFVGGHLADTIGRKTVALIALLGSAGMAILLPSFHTRFGILGGVFLFALLNDMYRPAVSAILTDSVASDLRPTAFGLMYLAINLGAAIAPTVGGFLAESDYTFLFWADAATSIAYAVVIAIAVPETLRKAAQEKTAPSVVAADGDDGDASSNQVAGSPPSAATTTGSPPDRPDGFRAVLRDRLFLRVCLGTLLVSLTYVQAMSTLPIYLGQLDIGAKTYGRLIAINGAMIVVAQIFVTRLVTRFDRGIMLALAAMVTAIGFGATAFAAVPWHFAATIVVWTLGEMMQSPVLLPVAADLAPPHLRARYFGTMTMCFSGANLLAASVSGVVLSQLGGPALWGMSFVVASIGAALYASTIPALRRRREEHTSGHV